MPPIAVSAGPGHRNEARCHHRGAPRFPGLSLCRPCSHIVYRNAHACGRPREKSRSCPRHGPGQRRCSGLELHLWRRRKEPRYEPVRREGQDGQPDAGPADTTCRQTRATIRCPGGRRSRYSSSVQNSSMKRSEWHVAGGARVKEHYPSQSAGSIQIARTPRRASRHRPGSVLANACAALCLRQDRPRGIRDRPQRTWRRAHSERWHSTGITGGR